jgi:hypothetical protein
MSYEANFLTTEYRKKLRQLKDAPSEQLRLIAIKHSPLISLPASCIVLISISLDDPVSISIWHAIACICGGLSLGVVTAAAIPKPFLELLSALLFDWCTIFKLRK